MVSVDSLPLFLKQLSLPSMLNNWEEFACQARTEQWSYEQYLANLAEIETNNRYQRRVARYTTELKLQPGKSLIHFGGFRRNRI